MQPTPVSPNAIRFGLFEADLSAGELRKRGRKIPLQDQPFRVLALLLLRPGELVSREEFQRALWPGDTFVEFDEGLNKAIQKLRQALDDTPDNPRFIETLPRKGYRFIAPVVRTASEASAAKAQPTPVDGNAVSSPAVRSVKRRGTEVLAWVLFGVVSAALVVLAGVYLQVLRPSSRTTLKTVPLTSYPGWQMTPAFSPDGKQVAFAWGGEKGEILHIYVKLADAGTPLRLTSSPTDEYAPAWSPDARYIAFCRDVSDRSEIWMVPALGGAERKLGEVIKGLGGPGGPGCGLSWSPDGKSIAVVDRTPPQGVSGIFLLSMASGEKRKITSPPDGYLGDCTPMFSPDGRIVAFIRIVNRSGVGDLFVLPIAPGSPQGEPRRVTFDDREVTGLDWTEDGRDLVFSSNRSGRSSLWMVSAAGGMPRRVAVTGEHSSALSVSRTGHRLAYEHNVEQISIWRIPGPNSAGKGSPPVQFIASKQVDTSPKYSPDGRSILFHSTRSGDLEIWVCDSEGRDPVQLTSFGGATPGCARWSPDKRWIAFNVTKEGNSDLYVISVEGARVRRLTKDAFEETRPSWSKDGRWLYFGSHRTGEFQIWKMPVEGGAAVQLTKRGGVEAIESADGKIVYYAKLDVPGIWSVPVAGGEETQILDQGRVGGWALTSRGICFMVPPPDNGSAGPAIKFYSFDNRRVTTIIEFSREVTLMYSINNPLSISPDGRWVLYTQIDQSGSDLMLVENFR